MVTIYTKNNCKNCKKTKRLLMFSEIDYVEDNVEENDKAFDYVKNELGFTKLPVIVADGYAPFEYSNEDVMEFAKSYRN